MTGPLRDLLVADFSRVLAGPYATMLLADMGATVVDVQVPHADLAGPRDDLSAQSKRIESCRQGSPLEPTVTLRRPSHR